MKKLLIYFAAFIFASTAGENPFNKDHAVMFSKNSVALTIPPQYIDGVRYDAGLAYINNIMDVNKAPEVAEYFKTTERNVIDHFQNFVDLRERVEGKPFHVFHVVGFMPTMSEGNSSGTFIMVYTTDRFRQIELERLLTMKPFQDCLDYVFLYNTHQYEYYSLAGYFRTSLENVEEYVKGLRNAYIL